MLRLLPRVAADLSEAADKVGYFLDTVQLLLLSLQCECILSSAYLAEVGARGVEVVPLVVRLVVGRLRVRSVSICTFVPVKPLNRVPQVRGAASGCAAYARRPRAARARVRAAPPRARSALRFRVSVFVLLYQ